MSAPALVVTFAARLDRVLEHLRSELRPGDALVYRMFGGYYFAELAPPVSEDAIWQSPTFSGRKAEGQAPVPLTVAEAIATVTADRDALAAAFAAELADCAAVLLPAEHRAGALADPAVIAAWPVRTARSVGPSVGPAEALSHLLERVPNLPGEATPERTEIPAVTAWARPLTGGAYIPVAGGYFPSAGINALYRYLWAHSPLFAASQAAENVRALVDDEGARVWLAAVDSALKPRRDEDENDPVTHYARSTLERRHGYAGALVGAARKVAAAVFQDPQPVNEEAARQLTGNPPALLWDDRFVTELNRMGGSRADAVRGFAENRASSSGADLWHLWAPVDGPPGWLRALARELWESVWRPALARETRPVALSRFAVEKIGGVLLGRDVAGGTGGRNVLVDGTGKAIAPFELRRLTTQVDADALELLARPGVRTLTTITAARFVPWFAEQVQRRPDEHAPLVFEGTDGANAWGTVAAALGMDAGKHAAEVRGMLHALQATIIQYPNGDEAGVLHVDYLAGGGRGKASRLTIRPGRPWLSSDVHALPDSAEYRALAPIPALEGYAPPFVGDRRERAAATRLWLRLLVELAREAPDLSLGLGAHITGARWAELANTAGVIRPPPVLVGLLQDRWSRDGDDGPAVLERVGPDRWHLAPRFEAERRMLEDGGKIRRGASEGGRRSQRAKAEERARLADGLPRKGKGRKGR